MINDGGQPFTDKEVIVKVGVFWTL